MADKIPAAKTRSLFCGVKNCSNIGTKMKHLAFYPIPSIDKSEMRCIWLRNMGYTNKEIMKIINLFVCEEHFESHYKNYTGFDATSLTSDAIPTERLPYIDPLDLSDDSDVSEEEHEQCDEQGTTVSMAKEETILEEMPDDSDNDINTRQMKEDLNHMIQNFCDKPLNKHLNVLMKIQRKLSKTPDDMVYTAECKRIMVSIYMENVRAYHYMQNILGLPPVADIKEFIRSKPEVISEDFISILTTKVDSMSPDQVNCALCVYLLSIEPDYEYDLESDIIFGCCQGTDDSSQILTPANYALVAMARGMCDDWHQIVCFTFLHDTKDQSDFNSFFRPWIEKVVMKLLGIGLNIKVLIPNTEDLLINAFVYMRISEVEPYLTVNGMKIFYLFDPLSFLVLLTNTLRRCDNVQLQNMSALWQQLKKFCHIDQSQHRLAPNLTKDMFVVKPNQAYQKTSQNSAQVFSLETAAGISTYIEIGLIDQSAMFIAELIEKINCLFDTNHSNSLQENQIHSNVFSSNLIATYDDDIWESLVTYFKSLQLPNDGNNLVGCIITTLHNLRLLRNELDLEYNNILVVRSLNQDPLVAFIDEARLQLGIKANFTTKKLMEAMKENLMQNAYLKESNMEKFVEMANKLLELKIIHQKKIDLDFSDFFFRYVNSPMYIASFIINKICQDDDTKLINNRMYILKGAKSMNKTKSYFTAPDDEFLKFIHKLGVSYDKNLKFVTNSDKVIQTLMDSTKRIGFKNTSWGNEMSNEDIILIKRYYFLIRIMLTIENSK